MVMALLCSPIFLDIVCCGYGLQCEIEWVAFQDGEFLLLVL